MRVVRCCNPFLAASLLEINDTLPMVGVAVTGSTLWMIFLTAGLPGAVKEKNGERGKISFTFLKDPKFWLITGLLFCQECGGDECDRVACDIL